MTSVSGQLGGYKISSDGEGCEDKCRCNHICGCDDKGGGCNCEIKCGCDTQDSLETDTPDLWRIVALADDRVFEDHEAFVGHLKSLKRAA